MARPSVRCPTLPPGDPWLSVVLHELRNPLQPLRGALAVARHRGAADAVLQRGLDAADRQLDLLHRLLDDLACLGAGRHPRPLRRARVSMRRIVEQAALAGGAPRPAPGPGLSCVIAPGEHEVWGDADRLLQVVLNLLSNAEKYTPAAGGVRVLLQREAAEVVLQVQDDGCGLRAGEAVRIFQPFQRGRTAGALPGLGVGLAVVKRIVGLHGGTVGACSAGPGLGSTFTVRLPGYVSVMPRRRARTGPPRC